MNISRLTVRAIGAFCAAAAGLAISNAQAQDTRLYAFSSGALTLGKGILQNLAPLPKFDELGRPAWLFGETVHRSCTRAGYYEEGTFAHQAGDK